MRVIETPTKLEHLNKPPNFNFLNFNRTLNIQVLLFMNTHLEHHTCNHQGPVVRKVDNTIHWINLYPVDSAIDFLILIHWIAIYPVDNTIQQLNNWSLKIKLNLKWGYQVV